MPQISPMNWMMILTFFIYLILFLKKEMMYEKLNLSKKNLYKM